MSTNHTPNYNLSQWEATDKVLRVDFNGDNAKIDAALSGLDMSLSALSTAAAGKLGRGRTIYTYYPTGSGKSCSVNFPVTDWDEWEYVCVLVKYQDGLDQNTTLRVEMFSNKAEFFKVEPLPLSGYLVVFLPWHNGKRPVAGFVLADRFVPFSLPYTFENLSNVTPVVTSANSVPYPKMHFFGGK